MWLPRNIRSQDDFPMNQRHLANPGHALTREGGAPEVRPLPRRVHDAAQRAQAAGARCAGDGVSSVWCGRRVDLGLMKGGGDRSTVSEGRAGEALLGRGVNEEQVTCHTPIGPPGGIGLAVVMVIGWVAWFTSDEGTGYG